MDKKTKEVKKLTQELMKESIEEGAKLITYAFRDKPLEDPSKAKVLKEISLQIEATAEAILKNVDEDTPIFLAPEATLENFAGTLS